jgi:hypothetical protein
MSDATEQESFDFYDILVEQKPQSFANILPDGTLASCSNDMTICVWV